MNRVLTIMDLRSGVLAAIVAVLVWVWAEGESVTTLPVSVNVEFPDEGAGELLIRPEDSAWRRSITITLEGATLATRNARDVLGSSIRIDPSLLETLRTPGAQKPLDFRRLIESHPRLKPISGLVGRISPEIVNVRVVKMVKRDLPIRVELAHELVLDGEPVPTPALATMRLSEADAATITENAQLQAAVGEEELSRLRGDGPQTLSGIRLRLPAGFLSTDPASIVPEVVSVTLRIKQNVESAKLASVPVSITIPPTEDGAKWSIELLDKFLTDVSVTGPSDVVSRVRSGDLPIRAHVVLATDDLERAVGQGQTNPGNGGVVRRMATFFGVPSGVNCSSQSLEVRLRVTRRTGVLDAPATPPGGGQ